MARKPRPVDPTAGPLQEFAHDLRMLREKAGNPTYRSLAQSAGFGATALGEAAGGVRFPSLDVTLAYVGACGGDTAEWEVRWRQVDRLLSEPVDVGQGADERHGEGETEGEDEAADGGDAEGTVEAGAADGGEDGDGAVAEPAAPAAPADPAPPPSRSRSPRSWRSLRSRPSWRSWPARAAVGVVLVLIAGVAVLVSNTTGHGPAPKSTADVDHTCPAFTEAGAFEGETYLPQTAVRTGPSTSARLVRNLPPSCWMQFTGYCLGAVVLDRNDVGQPLPDERWFEIEGGDLVSSAVIHGNPPAGLRPNTCPGSIAAPKSISLGIVADPNVLGWAILSAHGSGVRITGYAAYFAPNDTPGTAPDWHEIGAPSSSTTGDGFNVPWQFGKAGQAPGTAATLVVAAACLAGDAPTDVTDAIQVVPANPATAKPALLPAATLAKAATAACAIP
ncbi:helix-turn-helix domain-containing protein [Actinospica sp. MGRD01-02]|uniref:Helix-turn-helix domain-containing protein n=1 Tax=Actinospica acidithermotolerans TaxID=2828514 RepID=A0A941E612_9ACTN|nr:helix-turn-helix domain-containing protein [Actinospica acidithermotolerans]MBR7825736.1 helix-turn-helix domain-containing protein [Actinospica acidithermotolerans]